VGLPNPLCVCLTIPPPPTPLTNQHTPNSLLIHHCGKALEARGTGPFFYCSKVESYLEARLWNDVFTWAEAKLGLTPVGTRGVVVSVSVSVSVC
jgi:hypothetical protein